MFIYIKEGEFASDCGSQEGISEEVRTEMPCKLQLGFL